LLNIFATGDHVIAEARGAMTTRAGQAYDNEDCLIYRFSGSGIVEMREYCDSVLFGGWRGLSRVDEWAALKRNILALLNELDVGKDRGLVAEPETGKGALFAATLANDVVMRITGQYSWFRSFTGKEAVIVEFRVDVPASFAIA
jgi:ketosteroid isomerase-like protein